MAKAQNSDSDFSDEDLTPLDISFNKASEHLKKITSKLDTHQLLGLYGLYKQGTEGPCNAPRPSWFDGRGCKKWDAWKALRDMPQNEAKEKYVALMQKYDPECVDEKASESSQPKESWAAVSSLWHSPEPELDPNNISILDAAKENLGPVISKLLIQNPNLKHEKDEDGLGVLHWAADRDATLALTAAIKGGCPVDAVDDNGQTALHYAVACGHVESIKILVANGASLLKDEEGSSPLDLAEDSEIRKILEGAVK